MVWIGTSGYNYPEWKGTFYPSGLAVAKMLPYYAERFPAVEVNYTFYRMPTASVIGAWAAATPPGFRFALKAPRRITHVAKLRDCAPLLQAFVGAAATLGPQLGPMLFQLAPTHKKDVAALGEFAAWLPPRARAAFEFRHPSWFDAEVFGLLRSRNLALCVSDGEKIHAPVELTADFAYFRLRDEGYRLADLQRWAATIRERAGGCSDVYVFFKHEGSGIGPKLAQMLAEELKEPMAREAGGRARAASGGDGHLGRLSTARR
jgi:uncharacterized protein YecE (DUF72 family)